MTPEQLQTTADMIIAQIYAEEKAREIKQRKEDEIWYEEFKRRYHRREL